MSNKYIEEIKNDRYFCAFLECLIGIGYTFVLLLIVLLLSYGIVTFFGV